MDFFHANGTCALASLIALHDVAADFTLHKVDFQSNGQNAPEFLAINPKGRVPALVVEGRVLTETPAILAYIAQTHPEAGLAPEDPMAFAQVQSFNSYLCSTLHVAHAHKMRGHRWTDDPAAMEALKKKVPESVGAAFRFVEDSAFEGPFVFGEHYSIADPYLFAVARWMEGDGLDPSAYPKVIAHRTMMEQRPAVQAALAA
ncbi:glutathione S-transferase family protein [Rhodovibrionaceae bacterium A322]